MAYFVADYEHARTYLETAFRLHREAGSWAPAARDAMELAEMHRSVFGNPSASRGWLERAKRLIDPHPECVEAGYLELAIMACDRPDVIDVERSADRALALAHRHGDDDLAIRALADGGFALVCQGRLREGFARIDEALAAISAGDARELATGPKSLCSVFSSCDRAGDVGRAEEWTRLVEAAEHSPVGVPVVLGEHCRLIQTGLLIAAGRWDEAETRLDRLLQAMHTGSPHRAETVARLAMLRLLRGRIEHAADLIALHEDALCMREPLARLHLMRNEPDAAIAVAESAISELGADRMRTAPLLDVVVLAHLLRGDLDAASASVDRLAALAAVAEGDAVLAHAALARGRVAARRHDFDVAIDALRAARRGFEAASRPLQAASARADLATALQDAGDVSGAVVEAKAALSAFERLGASASADQVAQFLRSAGVVVRVRTDGSSSLAGLTARETEVLDLVSAGLTNADIGQRLFISAKTVEHHVGRVLSKLGVRTRAEAAAFAARHG